jgi:hypothetical protein
MSKPVALLIPHLVLSLDLPPGVRCFNSANLNINRSLYAPRSIFRHVPAIPLPTLRFLSALHIGKNTHCLSVNRSQLVRHHFATIPEVPTPKGQICIHPPNDSPMLCNNQSSHNLPPTLIRIGIRILYEPTLGYTIRGHLPVSNNSLFAFSRRPCLRSDRRRRRYL